MSSLNCKAILFDLDGTLIDSAFRIQRLWADWGKRHGIPARSILEVMHGRRADETIRLVAPHLPLQDEVYALETDEVSDMDGVNPYSSAKDLLSKLSLRQWAIVTSGSLRVASARVRHVGLPTPEVFITADDVRIGKPAPDGYLLAANRLHVHPAECVVIEDAPAGIQAGKAAGMKVIGVASSRLPEELSQADVVVHQLADMDLHTTSSGIGIYFKP
jgi:haloacid dehalogenase superfamily, subfamily IA, variant 3 with third motif having DD or ED/haloacid dehalogenase superfamily, subfamily IA, variant 1 with third motif having Dx(3-4)D or Dx(3-4)E